MTPVPLTHEQTMLVETSARLARLSEQVYELRCSLCFSDDDDEQRLVMFDLVEPAALISELDEFVSNLRSVRRGLEDFVRQGGAA